MTIREQEQQAYDAAMRAILPEVFDTSPFIHHCPCGQEISHSAMYCQECLQEAADDVAEYNADKEPA